MSAPEGRAAKLPVHVLTGFLGAGKTSLLRRLLASPALADTAVLINEFGEVGLDHLLVEAVDEDIVLLKSGCVCCTVRTDLKEGLVNLMEPAGTARCRPSRGWCWRPPASPIPARSSPR